MPARRIYGSLISSCSDGGSPLICFRPEDARRKGLTVPSALFGGVEDRLRRRAVQGILPTLHDIFLGDDQDRRDDEGGRRLAEETVAGCRRHGASEFVGLVDGDGRDIAALD